MKKNENEKVTITVSSRPNDMRGWFEEKSGRILEELSFLADVVEKWKMWYNSRGLSECCAPESP